jgi:hypothetical protein
VCQILNVKFQCQKVSVHVAVTVRWYPLKSFSISIVKPTRCTISQIYFILEQHSTCFGLSIIRSLRLYIQFQVCVIQGATEPVWYDAVSTVLDSWWWTERLSETCRVLFQNKINLRYWASGWFYRRNILRCTILQTSKINSNHFVCKWSHSVELDQVSNWLLFA